MGTYVTDEYITTKKKNENNAPPLAWPERDPAPPKKMPRIANQGFNHARPCDLAGAIVAGIAK